MKKHYEKMRVIAVEYVPEAVILADSVTYDVTANGHEIGKTYDSDTDGGFVHNWQ